MKVRRTRMGRSLALWIGMFLATIFLVARPTGFSWAFWIYGLIWGTATTALYYLLRRFLEEEVEIDR